MVKGKYLRIIKLMALVVGAAVLVAGCRPGEQRGRGPEPKDLPANTVDNEGYTLVEVLAELTGDPLQDPVGVAVDTQGNIYVADKAANQLFKYSRTGELVAEIGSVGREPGQFVHPVAVSLDKAGNIYVADAGNNRVQVLDAAGRYLRQVGSRDEFARFFSLEDGYDIPLTGVTADDDGNIYITLSGAFYDISTNSLRKYSPSGEMAWEIGSMLQGDIDLLPFTQPAAVTRGKDGTIYMSHGANGAGKVIVIPFQGDTPVAEGAFQFGDMGSNKGELLVKPEGVAVDEAGNIYVADTYNNRIQVFDAQGRWLLMFRLKGTRYGELTEPTGLTLDQEGNLYVADRGNARVLKIANPLQKTALLASDN